MRTYESEAIEDIAKKETYIFLSSFLLIGFFKIVQIIFKTNSFFTQFQINYSAYCVILVHIFNHCYHELEINS